MTHQGYFREGRTVLPKVARLTSYQKALASRLRKLFHDANDEVFEDGMTSHFSNELHDTIREYGIGAIDQLEEIIHADYTSVEVAEEALRQTGYVNDSKTHDARLSLLERALGSPDVRMRDAALIGIEAMEDPRVIPSLKRAVENEPSGWLRQYLKDVMARLKA